MKDFPKKNSLDYRKQHNADILRRMRTGESLTAFDSRASWFPPRPIIKKDEREMARLYENAQGSKVQSKDESDAALTVVTIDGEAS